MPSHVPCNVISHVQQMLASGLLLLFGLLALRVWRRAGGGRGDRPTLAWGVTAAYFIVSGGYSAAHALLAAVCGVVGYGSPFGLWVGSWSIPANLARGVLSVVYAVLLLLVLVAHRHRARRVARASPSALAACAVAATAVLLVPGVTSLHVMSSGLAVLSTLTAIVMMGALLAAVLNDGMDQLLWAALALYALKETVSVSVYAVLAFWTVAADAQAWRAFYWGAAALTAAMCLVALRRLRLAAEGRHVPALFERVYTLRRYTVL